MAAFKKPAIVGLALLAAASVGVAGFSLVSATEAPPTASPAVASYLANPPKPTEEVATLPATKRPTVASAVGLLGDPGRKWTLNVLGDSTGNDSNEYVFLLAEQLSAIYDRPVLMHRWLDGKYAPAVRIGEGVNAPIHIWNGSVPGTTGEYALDHMEAMAVKSADLVILNYGHNYKGGWNAETVTLHLVKAVDEQIQPKAMLFMFQNPQNPETPGPLAAATTIRGMVTAGKYEAVDVYKAFKDTGNVPSLMLDSIHPNPAGSKVWADAVAKRLSL